MNKSTPILLPCIELISNAYRATVNMINIQPEQLAPDTMSVSVLMCRAIFSRPIALDTAAQKQNGHVTRWAPY